MFLAYFFIIGKNPLTLYQGSVKYLHKIVSTPSRCNPRRCSSVLPKPLAGLPLNEHVDNADSVKIISRRLLAKLVCIAPFFFALFKDYDSINMFDPFRSSRSCKKSKPLLEKNINYVL